MKEALDHFLRFLNEIQDPSLPGIKRAFEKIRCGLSIIIVLFEKLGFPLDLDSLLWVAFYMLTVVSRFTGEPSNVVREGLRNYFDRRVAGGKPFVDPNWKKVVDDVKRCGFDMVLEGMDPLLYVEEGSQRYNFNWSERGPAFRLRPQVLGEGGSSMPSPPTDVNTAPDGRDPAKHVVPSVTEIEY